MAKLFAAPTYQTTLAVLAGTTVGVAVIGGLYWARPVLIPVALAIFLAFPLSPLVTALEKLHLRRTLSVLVVVVLVALILGGIVWLVNVQLSSLINKLPSYTENIQSKVQDLREMGHGGGIKRLEKLGQDIIGEWEREVAVPPNGSAEVVPSNETAVEKSPPAAVSPESAAPAPVARPQSPRWLARLTDFLSPVVTSLGYLALALVLVVFMLLERESLRNRLIRIVGNGRITGTTKALEDAGARISRYLLMQLAVNSGCGLIWGLALFALGVDYALLWGFLAAIMRFIPYVGAPFASLLPITQALAQFPGWWVPLALIAIVLVMELISNNVVEPWLYGQSIGVSEVAMVIAATFWTFLWGPFGLVMSAPLTVCLVVLGKHVPELKFFAVLLSDAPALDKDLSYYQRLLARDQDEAAHLVLSQAKASSPELVYDELLIPGLIYAKRDRERDLLTDADERFIHQATHELLEDLGEHRLAAAREAAKDTATKAAAATKESAGANGSGAELESEAEMEQSPPVRVQILACPARDQADAMALEMLRELLNPAEWEVEVTPLETLTTELVAHAAEERFAVICIGALPPGGLTHTRYLCKRLRAQNSTIKIIVGRWGLKNNLDANRERLQEVGADVMTTALLETRDLLNRWRPQLAREKTRSITTAPELISVTA